MPKQPVRVVGQLGLQIAFPAGSASHAAGTTEASVPVLAPADHGQDARKASSTTRPSPQRPRKWYSLIDKVYALPNLQSAWERVRANGGAPGRDGMTVQKFAEGAEQRLQQLSQELRAKTYRPQPVRRVQIPKSGGGLRPLGIPTVRDRIVQQALLQVLGPIFEGKFSSRSHGFRPGKGCGTALHVVDRAVRAGYAWVVDADLQAFFDTVDHARLIAALNEEIADGSVLNLITRILQAGVCEPATAEWEPTQLGTPQGGPLSPLLANVYLHPFDVRMTEAGYGLVRYADDFVIFAKSESEAEAALQHARALLEGELGLRLHPEKTRVVSVDTGFEFLGYRYHRSPRTGRLGKVVRGKSVQRFRAAIRALTPKLQNQRPPKRRQLTPTRLARNAELRVRIGRLNRFLQGWHGYFCGVWSRGPIHFRDFDQFVRRRLRTAITGRTNCGWWNSQLPNALLRDLGLISLDERQKEYLAGLPQEPPGRAKSVESRMRENRTYGSGRQGAG